MAIGIAGEITLPEKSRTPVLDLHGKKDRPGVLDGAGHFFTGLEGELGRQVGQFLDTRLRQ